MQSNVWKRYSRTRNEVTFQLSRPIPSESRVCGVVGGRVFSGVRIRLNRLLVRYSDGSRISGIGIPACSNLLMIPFQLESDHPHP